MRWTPTRKAETVIAIEKGSITTEEAKKNYRLSDEELAAWMCNYSVRGLAGLRATKPQHDGSRLPQEAEGVIWHRLASITSPPPQRVTRVLLAGRRGTTSPSAQHGRPPTASALAYSPVRLQLGQRPITYRVVYTNSIGRQRIYAYTVEIAATKRWMRCVGAVLRAGGEAFIFRGEVLSDRGADRANRRNLEDFYAVQIAS
jgi:Protein of unknown function (DUF1153)